MIIIRIIIYYDYYFYLKAVRQNKDCHFISLMLEMLSPCYWLVHFTKLMSVSLTFLFDNNVSIFVLNGCGSTLGLNQAISD